MSALELQRYLHEHLPLTRAMGVTVVSVHEDEVRLQAPLAPNINHHATVFGGSASALAILAGWSLLHTRLASGGLPARLVIQRNTMEYERPIAGTFSARATFESPAAWPEFETLLRRRGRARITVPVVLEYGSIVAGRFSGQFVALAADAAAPG
ncbi:MAG: thioesterase domain-containing protein [Proteobacteria bacterium]|nr:thioesterase domain-containing protein [Pseudomonadota bacterium]